LKDLASGR